MENHSRLPGERFLDHPGVPTGRGGHRSGLKTVGGIFWRLFCGLPAPFPECARILEWVRVHPVNIGLHPQTAPRLQGPNIGSNKPCQTPHVFPAKFFLKTAAIATSGTMVAGGDPGTRCASPSAYIYGVVFGDELQSPLATLSVRADFGILFSM